MGWNSCKKVPQPRLALVNSQPNRTKQEQSVTTFQDRDLRIMSAKKKAIAKKDENEAERAALKAKADEAAEAATWESGAKDSKKLASKADAEAEKLRKAKEKKDLEAADAEMLAGVVSKKTNVKKKKGDDFDMLQAALAAAPKTKAQKEAEAKKKAEEDAKKARQAEEEANREARAEAAAADPDAAPAELESELHKASKALLRTAQRLAAAVPVGGAFRRGVA